MLDNPEAPEEIKLLLRDLSQAAKTMLDVGASMEYAVAMFRLQMRREAMARTANGHNHCQAARILGEHRNTYVRGLRSQFDYPVRAQPQRAAPADQMRLRISA